jgi:hypothetical protein
MLNIRRPAHTGLIPQTDKWEKPNEDEINIFKNCIENCIIQSLQKRVEIYPTDLTGCYRVTCGDSLFIKVLAERSYESQCNAEKMASWLYQSGLNVSCIKDGFPKKIDNEKLWVFAYNYIEHIFSDRSDQQLYLIGKEIGFMHKLMCEYPDRDIVKEKGTNENSRLLEQLKDIKKKYEVSNFPLNAIEIIRNTSDSDFKLLTRNAQLIHGDLNYGNVLMNKDTNKPIIIDFEDATSAWLHPLYDLALAIQRFVLISEKNDKYKCADALIRGYFSENKQTKLNKDCSLKKMIELISVRSLLILSIMSENVRKLYLDEIDKFVELHKKTQEDKDLISDIGALIY